MLSLIRKTLKQFNEQLKGDVESDGAHFGGRKKAGKDNKYLHDAMQAKSAVLGAVERGGRVRATVVPNMGKSVITDFVRHNIKSSGTRLLTDNARILRSLEKTYDRHSVDHHKGEYVRGDVHINSMENFWSHAKRSIRGTYKVISKKYVQSYLDAFVFHYNNRHNDRKRFETLLRIVLLSSKQQEIVSSS
jgi:transposase-like protein